MPIYIYEAVNEEGNVVRGVLDADNRTLALRHLRQYRFRINKLEEQTLVHKLINRLHGFGVRTLALFSRQMASMTKAGLPIMRCFELLSSKGENRRFENLVLLLREQVKGGNSLSAAFGRYPKVFDPVFLSLIRAGEVSGEMPDILDRIATYLEKEYTLRQRIRASLTYPMIIFIFCATLSFLLITYIFPRFINLFSGFHLTMPLPTRILLFLVDTLRNPIFVLFMLAAAAAAFFLSSQYVKTYIGRKHFHHWLINLPVVGSINRKVAISRFCRTFSTLYASGVPVMQSLQIVSHVTGNEIINEAIIQVLEAVKYGSTISAPLEESGFFPPMVINLIQVGEKTGYLSGMLAKVADFYDMEVELSLLAFTKLLEPLLIGFMGGVVGLVLLSIFMPIYQLIGNFGH